VGVGTPGATFTRAALSPTVPDAMPNFDPNAAAANWATAMQQASAKATAGAQRVQESPGARAAAQAQKWLNRVNESAQKWQRKVGAVTLQEWRDAYINKGVPRIASGAQAALPAYQQALTPLLAFEANLWAQIDGMPSTTEADRENRMLAWVRGMRQYQAPS
jgi:hypothetical protein